MDSGQTTSIAPAERMPTVSLSIADAQRDMRFAYLSGAPGILASAAAWLVAGLLATYSTPQRAIVGLFIGGIFIHPIGVMITKALGRPGNHTKGNPLGTLALESTLQMLLCLPLAYTVSRYRVEWFFPAMLLIIGGRYLTFATMYGRRIYWVCGGALAIAAYLLVAMRAPVPMGANAGAAIEAMFGLIVLMAARKSAARKLVAGSIKPQIPA